MFETPEVDPIIVQFLAKLGWNPYKGLESSLHACQDIFLDIFGPLTTIFKVAKGPKATNQAIDPHKLSGWVQRAVCIAGNVNISFSIQRHKAILFKVKPKLANLAQAEAGKEADSLLFGDSLVKAGTWGHSLPWTECSSPCARSSKPGFLPGIAGPGFSCQAVILPVALEH